MNEFPTTPQALTSDWLSQTLGAPVRDFAVAPLGEGVGILGQVTRVTLDWDGPYATLIAKFASPVDANVAVAMTYDMYGREVNFYTRLAEHIEVARPRCYGARINADRNQFVLLLEDLVDYDIGDQVAGCDERATAAVVRALAAFHASGWQPANELDLVSHNNSGQRDGMVAGFAAGWPVVCDQFADLIPAAARDIGDLMSQATPRLLAEMCAPPVAITHADVRLDNVFFRPRSDGATDVSLVDWQSVCTSAPEHDLAYFLTQSVPADVRAARDWPGLYFDALSARGIDYDRATFERRYLISALYLLNYAVVIAGTLDLANERGAALGRTLLGRSLQALDELGAYDFLKSY
ncbi:MAG: phosphotransferase [Pseudomonadota bacterium]